MLINTLSDTDSVHVLGILDYGVSNDCYIYIYIYIYNIESSYQIPKGPKDKIEYTSNQASGSNTNEGFCTEVDEN